MSLVVGSRASLASAFNGHSSSPLQSSRPPSRLVCTASSSRGLNGWHSDDGRLESLSSSSEWRKEGRNEDLYSSLEEYRFGPDCPKPLKGHKRSVVAFSVAQPFSGVQEEDAVQEPLIVPGADVKSIREWELDFCSRPIVDARGKKVWELLICDGARNLQFSRFYPNNVINSLTLKDALLSLIQYGLPKPEKIRFFRSQMQNIVSKACRELDIQAVPSRRCISLIRWLDERYDTVYSKHPGFQESATPLLQLEQSFPLELPDNLRGDQWAFVQLPLQGVIEEVTAVEEGSSFGSSFPLEILGLDLPSNAVIPGVAVASSRATPLAAWTNALELASIQVDRQKKCLVLSTGVSDRWLYAYYRKSRQADQEAEAWEATKKTCGGLHFLAVQKTLDSDVCAGFWLLYDGPPSRV